VKKTIHVCVLFFALIAWTRIRAAHAQAGGAEISLLDRNGKAVASIVDGNRVQLRIKMNVAVGAEAPVQFSFSDISNPIAQCTIKASADSCETSAFAALGWYWGADGSATSQRTINATANGDQTLGSLTISIAPRPVVMVHGFNSSYQAWTAYLGPQGFLAELGLRGFAVGDSQVPGVMETGSLATPLKRTNTIAQNAAILGEYIDNVQKMTDAEKVDLLVHSMGGLISRYYIDRVMTDDDVAQLIILGTPMAGSACSILPASLGMMLPATLEIQPSYMTNVFNQQIVHRRGVMFHALAGTKLLEAVASPCTPVPSDVVVTLDSVRAIPMPVEEVRLLHTELTSSPEVFHGFVTRLLKTPPGGFETAADRRPAPTLPPPSNFRRCTPVT